MANVIEDFFVGLGFQIDDAQLALFDAQVEAANQTLLALGAAAIAGAAGIFAFVEGVTDGIDDLSDFAAVNNVGIEGLQELGFAAQASGSSLDAVKSSVAGLNSIIGEAALGVGKGAATFEKLGLSAKDSTGKIKSAEDVMQEVGDRFKDLSAQERIALASKLGIDASLIPLLSQGSEGIAKLRAEARSLGVVTQEQADISGTLHDALDRLSFLVLSLSRDIAVALTPMIEGVVTKIKDFVVANREVINTRIVAFTELFGAVLGVLWTVVSRVIGVLAKLVSVILDSKIALIAMAAAASLFITLNLGRSILGLVNTFRALTASVVAFDFALLAIPLAVGAIVVAIGLLIDDFLTFQEGGDSVVGDLAAKFPILGDAIRAVSEVVTAAFTWWRGLVSQVGDSFVALFGAVWRLVSVLATLLWPIIKTVFEGWGLLLGAVLPPLLTIATTIIDVVASAIEFAVGKMTAFVDLVTGAANALAEFFGADTTVSVKQQGTEPPTKAVVAQALAAQAVVGAGKVGSTSGVTGASVAAGNKPGGQVTNNNTSSITAPITIITADPAKAGESVKKELAAMNKQATRNNQTATKL